LLVGEGIRKMKTHKGTIYDMLFLSVMLVMVMSGIVIVYYTFNQIHAGLQSAGLTPTELQPSENALEAIANWNSLLLFVYIGAGIGSVISAFAVRTHPIFFLAFLLIQVLTIALTPIYQDIYTAISSNPTLNTTATTVFPAYGQIMDYLPVITLILSCVIALAMFAIPTGG
jgi:hypothetical protein